jgi:chromosome segregation ATPase
MASDDMVPGNEPFGGGPFEGGGSPPAEPGGDFLDDLRKSGEESVDLELRGLQSAMSRVESFAATVGEADLDALRNEWQQIETELKRALQSGLHAVEERTTLRTPAAVDQEITGLADEIGRKNELIAQLTDTVKKLNREVDDKERRLRDEARSLRDKAVQDDEELGVLRVRAAELEQARARLTAAVDATTAERDVLRAAAQQAAEALEAEKADQKERYEALRRELEESHASNAKLEAERRDSERRATDAERRLQASEKGRERAEQERQASASEAARAQKESRSATESAAALTTELATLRERLEKEVKRLRRANSRMKADGETARSRAADALAALQQAAALLEARPKADATDDESPEEAPSQA